MKYYNKFISADGLSLVEPASSPYPTTPRIRRPCSLASYHLSNPEVDLQTISYRYRVYKYNKTIPIDEYTTFLYWEEERLF